MPEEGLNNQESYNQRADNVTQRGERDREYSGRFWERKRDAGMKKEAITAMKRGLERDIQGMAQGGTLKFEVESRPFSEADRERLSAMRRLTEQMGFQVGNFYRDVETDSVMAKVERTQTREQLAKKDQRELEKVRVTLRERGIQGESVPFPENREGEVQENFDRNVAENHEVLKAFAKRVEPEPLETYEHSLERITELLEKEKGVVELDPNVSTIILSDIHARREFLTALMEREIKLPDSDRREKVFTLLQQGKINVVCVGDGMHSERPSLWEPERYMYDERGKRRIGFTEYGKAYNAYSEAFKKVKNQNPRYRVLDDPTISKEEYNSMLYEIQKEYEVSDDPEIVAVREKFDEISAQESERVMNTEMARGLGLMKMVMDLKVAYPQHFHFLRGNHEDVDADLVGDFGKGEVNQSIEVRAWLEKKFGHTFVKKWASFEDDLPLLAKGKNLIVTHAAPAQNYTREQVENREKKTTVGLTWTENRQGKSNAIPEGRIQGNIESILANLDMPEDTRWFIGHRPMDGNESYRSQCNGKLFQINDDKRMMVAFVPHKEVFNPEQHITDLSR
ncbi:MAG: metallophosphoesterase [Candidatus Portnoybacteria bacterium]|nr:metallophosphoesterase [Candidatus Portnoybacteria bacterium]